MNIAQPYREFPGILLKIATLLFLICSATPERAYSQRQLAAVNVQVSDFESETPLSQAEVRLFTFGQGNPTHRSYTDGAGRVTLPGVGRGNYYLEVVKLGYETAREPVDVSPGANESFSIRLRPKTDSSTREVRTGAISAAALAIPPEAQQEYEKGAAKLKDDPVKSAEHFRKAIKKFPAYAEAYTMLALLYMRNKETGEALKALAKAIELNPKLASAHTLLGRLYIEERKFNEAEKSLLEATRLDPQSWNGPYELARCYYNLGKLDPALTYAKLAQSKQGAPSSTHLLLVDIYLGLRDEQNALRELEEFAKAEPNSPLMPRVQKKIDRLRKQ